MSHLIFHGTVLCQGGHHHGDYATARGTGLCTICLNHSTRRESPTHNTCTIQCIQQVICNSIAAVMCMDVAKSMQSREKTLGDVITMVT